MFVARIRNVYAVSFVRLSTAWLVSDAPLPSIVVHATPAHVPPVFCWYWYLNTYDGSLGALHVSTVRSSPTAAARPVGFAGTGIGVARMPVATCPAFVRFTASSWNWCGVPFSSPVAVSVVVDAPLPATLAHAP